jgi:hypothetical protein
MILDERTNYPGKLRVLNQLAVLPTGNSISAANPNAPIAPGEEASNRSAREMLTCRRLPWDGSNAIESKQAEFGAEPEKTVRRLSNCVDAAFEKAFADRPRLVRVLINVERWV